MECFMSNELNWFHIRRWSYNRMVREHQFEMTKQVPKDVDSQIMRMLAQGNVTIKKSTEDREEKEDKDKKNEKRK